MYYGEIKKCDIANGEGVRVSLFVSGCTHHCPGCFNADTWNFKYGSEYTDQTEKEILEALSPSYINGLTLLGGEPFEPENQKTLVGLLRKVRESYPEKNIWCACGRRVCRGVKRYPSCVQRFIESKSHRCEKKSWSE